MAERYTISKEQNYENYIYPKQPVRVEIARILIDNLTNQKVAQVKFINISNKLIDNITFTIVGYEVTGQELFCLKDIQIASLTVSPDNAFGGNHSFTLEDSRVDHIEVIVNRVVFSTGSAWVNEEGSIGIFCENQPKPIAVKEGFDKEFEDLKQEYHFRTDCKFEKNNNYWRCSCKHLNNNNIDHCYFCKTEKEVLEKCFSNELLYEQTYKRALNLLGSNRISELEESKKLFAKIQGYKDSELLMQKCDECIEKQKIKKEEKSKKGKRIIRRLAIMGAVVLVIIIIASMVMSSINTKDEASKYAADEQYVKAMETLDGAIIKLPNYSTLKEQWLKKAFILSKKRYILKETLNYIKSNRSDEFDELLYSMAVDYVKDGEFEPAYFCLKQIQEKNRTKGGEKLFEKKYKMNLRLSTIDDGYTINADKMGFYDWVSNLVKYQYSKKNYNEVMRITKRVKDYESNPNLAELKKYYIQSLLEKTDFNKLIVELPMHMVSMPELEMILKRYKTQGDIVDYSKKSNQITVRKDNCFESGESADVDFYIGIPKNNIEICGIRIKHNHSKKWFDSIKKAYGVSKNDIEETASDYYLADHYEWLKEDNIVNYVRAHHSKHGKEVEEYCYLYIENKPFDSFVLNSEGVWFKGE